jgi:uncharacterized membrane protein
MADAPRPRIPARLLVIDTIGVILAGLGIAGLLTDLSNVIPAFRDKTIAGMVAGIGFALVTFALGNIFKWLKYTRSQSQPPEGP